MSQVIIPTGTFIFVCDGAKARLFRNSGTAQALKLTQVYQVMEDHAAARDIGTDRAGRAYSSTGSHRSSVEISDPHEAAEIDFLQRMVEKLDARIAEHKPEALIIAAPPKALAIVRQAMTPAMKAILISELHKDLAGLPIEAVQDHLA